MVTVIEAVRSKLRRQRQPVITWFEVDRIIRELYRERQYDGQPLSVRTSVPSSLTLAKLKTSLIPPEGLHTKSRDIPIPTDHRASLEEKAAIAHQWVLSEDPDFPATVCRVSGVPDAPADEVCCIVDPWCYVSHLSAMQGWGITNRNPQALHLTRPAKTVWHSLAKEEIRKEYPQLEPGQRAPKPRARVTFPPTVRQRPVSVFETTHPGKHVKDADRDVRLSTIGQTFHDMLKEPDLCGGMTHVIEVWEKHAETYLDEITENMNAPDVHTTKMELVRAGVILNEMVGISDDRIDKWLVHVERGGSRKLDPGKPYAPTYSARWGVSLNV